MSHFKDSQNGHRSTCRSRIPILGLQRGSSPAPLKLSASTFSSHSRPHTPTVPERFQLERASSLNSRKKQGPTCHVYELSQEPTLTDSACFWKTLFSGLATIPFPQPPTHSNDLEPRLASSTHGPKLDICHPDFSGDSKHNRIDVATRIIAAWSGVLASYTDDHDHAFGVSLDDHGFLPLRIDYDGEKITSVFLHEVGVLVQRIWSDAPNTDMTTLRSWSSELEKACSFSSGIRIRSTTGEFKGSTTTVPTSTNCALLLDVSCHADHVTLDASFDDRFIDGDTVQSMLNSAEHIAWQLGAPQQSLPHSVACLEILSPTDKRQIIRLNRP